METVLYSFVWTSGTPHLFLRGLHIYDQIFSHNWFESSSIALFLSTPAGPTISPAVQTHPIIENQIKASASDYPTVMCHPCTSHRIMQANEIFYLQPAPANSLVFGKTSRNQSPTREPKSKLNLPFTAPYCQPYITPSKRSSSNS